VPNYKFERIDKNDCALLIVNHQVGLFQLVRDWSPNEIRNNILAHSALAQLYNLPVVLTTDVQEGMSTTARSVD
jgi:nicotinamidase-related amidase